MRSELMDQKKTTIYHIWLMNIEDASYEFIDEFADYMNWSKISSNQNMSEEFMNRYHGRIITMRAMLNGYLTIEDKAKLVSIKKRFNTL